jgi:hypothetical protein
MRKPRITPRCARSRRRQPAHGSSRHAHRSCSRVASSPTQRSPQRQGFRSARSTVTSPPETTCSPACGSGSSPISPMLISVRRQPMRLSQRCATRLQASTREHHSSRRCCIRHKASKCGRGSNRSGAPCSRRASTQLFPTHLRMCECARLRRCRCCIRRRRGSCCARSGEWMRHRPVTSSNSRSGQCSTACRSAWVERLPSAHRRSRSRARAPSDGHHPDQ